MVRSLCRKSVGDMEYKKKRIWPVNLNSNRDYWGDNNKTYLREIIKCIYGLYSVLAVAKHISNMV